MTTQRFLFLMEYESVEDEDVVARLKAIVGDVQGYEGVVSAELLEPPETKDVGILSYIEVESGTSLFTGNGFCTIRAADENGNVMVGQLDPGTTTAQGVIFIEAAVSARHDSALVAILRNAGLDDNLIGAMLLDWRGKCEEMMQTEERDD